MDRGEEVKRFEAVLEQSMRPVAILNATLSATLLVAGTQMPVLLIDLGPYIAGQAGSFAFMVVTISVVAAAKVLLASRRFYLTLLTSALGFTIACCAFAVVSIYLIAFKVAKDSTVWADVYVRRCDAENQADGRPTFPWRVEHWTVQTEEKLKDPHLPPSTRSALEHQLATYMGSEKLPPVGQGQPKPAEECP